MPPTRKRPVTSVSSVRRWPKRCLAPPPKAWAFPPPSGFSSATIPPTKPQSWIPSKRCGTNKRRRSLYKYGCTAALFTVHPFSVRISVPRRRILRGLQKTGTKFKNNNILSINDNFLLTFDFIYVILVVPKPKSEDHCHAQTTEME